MWICFPVDLNGDLLCTFCTNQLQKAEQIRLLDKELRLFIELLIALACKVLLYKLNFILSLATATHKLTLVLPNRSRLYFTHLELELLTQFTAPNDDK